MTTIDKGVQKIAAIVEANRKIELLNNVKKAYTELSQSECQRLVSVSVPQLGSMGSRDKLVSLPYEAGEEVMKLVKKYLTDKREALENEIQNLSIV